jgi:hypothetical protein
MGVVGDAAGLEKIFLLVKEEWEEEWQEYLINLATLIGERFQTEDLKNLCFRLDVEYDDLPAETKSGKARELVAHSERHNRMDELVQEGKKLRSKVNWPQPPAVIDERWQQVDWAMAARRYEIFIRIRCGTMRIYGQPKLITLEEFFTEVFLLMRPRASRYVPIEILQKVHETGQLFEQEVECQSGLETVQTYKRLFILGKPGAGKTTFLKYIALQAVSGRYTKVPIFVPLKRLSDSENIGDFSAALREYVEKCFDACEFPDTASFVERLLQAGRVILLFDGLDTVKGADRQRDAAIAIEKLAESYPQNQFLITCRLATANYEFEYFNYVEVADFTFEQKQIFVSHRFTNDEVKQAAFLNELAKPKNKRLQELAQTPLLLGLLCLVFEETMAFPQRWAEIYERAIDILLTKWNSTHGIDREEIYHDLSVERRQQMLAHIAAKTFKNNVYYIPQRELERMIVEYLRQISPVRQAEEIDGRAVLKAIEAQHGILVERTSEIYSFVHLTFQEYFIAWDLVKNETQRELDRLISKHLGEQRWREVFLLTASLLENTEVFFNSFLAKLETMAASEPFLVNLLSRPEMASGSTARRVAYLYLALDIAREQDSDFTTALSAALPYDLGRTSDFKLADDLANTYRQARDLAHAHEHMHDFEHTDYPKISSQEIHKAIKVAQKFGLDELQTSLSALVIPDTHASIVEWQGFANQLQQVIRDYIPWAGRRLSKNQKGRLINYLKANLLLLNCLELSLRSNPEAIKNRMLRLPE